MTLKLKSESEPLLGGSITAAEAQFTRRPRLGFLGVGWIGQNRMEAIAKSGFAEIAAIADTSPRTVTRAQQHAPQSAVVNTLEDLLEMKLDGVAIATPSALHADQAVHALENRVSVFCQKPLGRNADETRRVIDTARRANVLLGVDLSYRFMSAVQAVRHCCREGRLGSVYALDLEFHNAYGPDKPWFYDRAQSGGGCVIDLGIHLVDLALWILDFPPVSRVTSKLYAKGQPLKSRPGIVEDYCEARIDFATGATARIACSWKLPAGKDAVIRGSFFGTEAGAGFRNVNGSFYDFIAELYTGTRTERIADNPDQWGGLAAVNWARRLSEGETYDESISHLGQVAHVLDCMYENA